MEGGEISSKSTPVPFMKIQSLSEIPSAKEIGTGKFATELPVFCLALVRNTPDQCYLLVTDFSKVKSTHFKSDNWKNSIFSVAKNDEDSSDDESQDKQHHHHHSHFTLSFPVAKSGNLGSNKVFVIVFQKASMADICHKFAIDTTSKGLVNLVDRCLFITVQFKVKTLGNKYTIGLAKDSSAIRSVNDMNKLKQISNIEGFMQRFLKKTNSKIRQKVPEDIAQIALKNRKRKYEGLSQMNFFKSSSSRGPSGSVLLFQQHKNDDNTQPTISQNSPLPARSADDTSRKNEHNDEDNSPRTSRNGYKKSKVSSGIAEPITLESEDEQPGQKTTQSKIHSQGSNGAPDTQIQGPSQSSGGLTTKDDSNKSNQKILGSTTKDPLRPYKNGVTASDIDDSQVPLNESTEVHDRQSIQFDSFLANGATVRQLRDLPDSPSMISRENTFKLTGYLRTTVSDLLDFVIKPYNRTLKLSNLRLYFVENLHWSSPEYLELEILTEEEFRKFFEINEIELFMLNMSETLRKLNAVVATSKKISVCVIKKYEDRKYPRSYWTVRDSLSSLTSQLTLY